MTLYTGSSLQSDFTNDGDEWDQDTQDILDSEEDEVEYENEL